MCICLYCFFRKMSSVDRRRELNRLAAQKLRNRQKEKAVTVKQVCDTNYVNYNTTVINKNAFDLLDTIWHNISSKLSVINWSFKMSMTSMSSFVSIVRDNGLMVMISNKHVPKNWEENQRESEKFLENCSWWKSCGILSKLAINDKV